MKGQPKGAIARGGRRGSGVVMERSAKGRGAATSNGGVDNASGTITASGTTTASGTVDVRSRGVVRGRDVVSEQQQTQARPKFNVRRGAHVPQVIRKINLFAGSQPTQGSSSQPVKASSS
ncbi:unnamed protein product [Prunus armeniaca]|uniref:Uncharacterized protein n=1 Tax=Prunus armeniaca TaxID=36596 RepID=A0A6J5XU23_PRUAR|nr:unnamed protein product [Prunus armeniaca]